jgi:5-methylcytosine-specific restriction endonuclease McrA
VTYSGRGLYSAFILDGSGREIARHEDSRAALEAWLSESYPGVPVRFVPVRNPPKRRGRTERPVTDRAQRYRANADPPPGPRICALCGSTGNIEVGHVNGHEEDSSPINLFWTCRRCNVRCGNTLRRAGMGRLTRQYNPPATGAENLGQWMNAVMSMKGEGGTMPVADAVAMIRATPLEDRSAFARQIWAKRRQRGTDRSVPF